MKLFNFRTELRITFKITLLLFVIFIIYLIFNYLYLSNASREDVSKKLSYIYTPILNDLKYNNGKWNTELYIDDSDIPYDNPIYVYTVDGFLIDRANIINGFLDKSDFVFAYNFKKPQNYISIINENWRLFSKSIIYQGDLKGTVLVGYFEPKNYEQNGLDVDLKDGADEISNTLVYQNGILGTNLKNRDIKFGGSYEIVDRHNNLVKGQGGLPSYIDPKLLNSILINKEFTIYDKKTNDQFTLIAKPIIAKNNRVGIVIVGISTTLVHSTLIKEFIFSIISAIIAIFIFAILCIYPLRREIEKKIKKEIQEVLEPEPIKLETISFDLENSLILINEDIKIGIPYDSASYYLCKIFFHSKRKQWELGTLLKAIGEEITDDNWRKVYDPVRKLNEKVREKVGLDLVTMVSNKFYKINPQLSPTIQ